MSKDTKIDAPRQLWRMSSIADSIMSLGYTEFLEKVTNTQTSKIPSYRMWIDYLR